ncbi:hypothetical protein SAMN02982931_01195 [Bauldia litoralis]|uniref:Uncharacterized protein n=1 Tax=Bauldia litoralis TaxID=665467 RepID=A0A1G6B3U9_9HYPH|nr:hypothetical protein SAMN02982931_01195 [Bauldia litoralis]
MTQIIRLAALSGFVAVMALSPFPAGADDNKAGAAAAAIVGAAAILGIAALAHHDDHHKNGQHHSDEKAEAKYERGYNDGLYNAPYHGAGADQAYRNGYDAGVTERRNRMAHNRDHEWQADQHSAPRLAMRACVGEASAKWNRRPTDIVPVKSRKIGGDDYLVQVAAGHRSGKCEVSGNGRVYLLENGKI